VNGEPDSRSSSAEGERRPEALVPGADGDRRTPAVPARQTPFADGQPSAGSVSGATPDQGSPLPPGDGTQELGKAAAEAVGDEYIERGRAGITRVYIYDNRSYGVYAEGTISARDISGHGKTDTTGAGYRERSARMVSVVTVASQDRNRLRWVAVTAGHREQAAAILSGSGWSCCAVPTGSARPRQGRGYWASTRRSSPSTRR
jgi:hypothetical protein